MLTGAERKFPDLYSTSSEMMVMFFSDASGNMRGFLANFSTGFNLGQSGTLNINNKHHYIILYYKHRKILIFILSFAYFINYIINSISETGSFILNLFNLFFIKVI